MSEKVRVVIDTQLFLRAAVNRQSLVGKIIFDLAERYVLVFSVETKNEVKDVLTRPKLRLKFKQLTDEVTEKVLKIFDSAVLIKLPNPIPSVSRDRKDDIFLVCEIEGNARYLVSEDKDLLVLNPYKGVQIVDVPAFFTLVQTSFEDTSE